MENENYSPGGGKLYKSDGSIIYSGDIIKSLENLLEMSLGGKGGVYSTAGTITPPTGKKIRVIEAATECSITAIGNVTGITARTLESGRKYYGKYTEVVIHSGEAIIYYGDD